MRFILTLLLGILPILATARDIVAVYDLDGPINESGQSAASLLNLAQASQLPITHFHLVQSLSKAVDDSDVKAIVLETDRAILTAPQRQEIHQLLLANKKAGKEIYYYSEYLTLDTATIGSSANHFSLMPEALVSLNGIATESLYFKTFLERLGINVEVIHIGDYKSAGETLYRDKPSDHALEQSKQLLDHLYTALTEPIAKARNIKIDHLLKLINRGNLTPEQALEENLVDQLTYRTDFVNSIRSTYPDAQFERNYKRPSRQGPEVNGLFDFVKLLMNGDSDRPSKAPYIAVIAMQGAISDMSIAPVRKEILKATRDDNCHALILRVDSPGGSALSSEVLWEATEEFSAKGRPFVVSMGSVAASGGYYIAANADQIFAEPTTITGSIGVVAMKPVMQDAMNKLGINVHSNQRGQHANLYSLFQPFSDAQEKLLRDSMVDVYGTFKKRVTEGRKGKLKGDIEDIAGGRVYTGKHALEMGLIDQLGGLHDAIAYTQEQLDKKSIPILLPKPKSAFEGLFASPPKDNHEFITASQAPTPLINYQELLHTHPALRAIDQQTSQQLGALFDLLETTRESHIQLIAPSVPSL